MQLMTVSFREISISPLYLKLVIIAIKACYLHEVLFPLHLKTFANPVKDEC